MKKILICATILLLLSGCGGYASRDYAQGTSNSTITEVGTDVDNNQVFVKEVVVTRIVDNGPDTYDKIFLRCTKDGRLLSGTVSNSYTSGKTRVYHTTSI